MSDEKKKVVRLPGAAVPEETYGDTCREIAEEELIELRRESRLEDPSMVMAPRLHHHGDKDVLDLVRKYVRELGGELEVVAVFSNRRITIKGL